MKRAVSTLGLVLLLAGCVTPMAVNEVNDLTTCRNTDLKKIHKSLLLNGYEIKTETADDLVTDWKQVAGYARDRTLRKVTVVKMGDGVYKFKVRVKSIRLETNSGSGMAITSADQRRRESNTVVLDFSQPVEVESENEQDYYEEYRETYYETQREVCGT